MTLLADCASNPRLQSIAAIWMLAGYYWAALPTSSHNAAPVYTVTLCPTGTYVTAITLYASSWFYHSGPVDYIGVPYDSALV